MASHLNAERTSFDAQTISILFFAPTWTPESFYDKIAANRSREVSAQFVPVGHQDKNPSEEALYKRKKSYDPPRYMSIQTVIPSFGSIH